MILRKNKYFFQYFCISVCFLSSLVVAKVFSSAAISRFKSKRRQSRNAAALTDKFICILISKSHVDAAFFAN